MEFYVKKVCVVVSDVDFENSDDEACFSQCFWIECKDLPMVLKMCRDNNKYVKIEIDYTK